VASRDIIDSPLMVKSSFFGSKKKRSEFQIKVKHLDEDDPEPILTDRVISKFSDFTGLKDEPKNFGGFGGFGDLGGLKNDSKNFGGFGAESKNGPAPMNPISVLA
jgi:hypothetical protein